MRIKQVILVVGVAMLGGMLAVSSQVSRGCSGLNQILAKPLVKQKPVSAVSGGSSSSVDDSVIYVLGGRADSLRKRFAKAAELYKQGFARKILIDSDDMLMEYSPPIGRNLTHNEWAIGKLIELGVEKGDIETVSIDGGLLGTYSEAKAITGVMSRRGYRALILVSSDYHTARVWYSFSGLTGQDMDLYIYPAKEDPTVDMLFKELIKFTLYRVFL